MRIISGTLKGRKLNTPAVNDTSIRPTSDRAREALFSILSSRVKGAVVLDLFSGTGALGLEAFSRGADFVVFVDHASKALEITKRNITLCIQNNLSSGELRVIRQDLSKPFSQKMFPKECHKGFDIIFADPPYGMNLSLSTLNFINNSSLLTKNGILIVEERNTIELPDTLSKLHQTDRRNYGDTVFNFYQNS